MGLLIFLSRGGKQLTELLNLVDSTDISLDTLENDIYGFTRCEAAAYILSLWKIPPRIIEAILLQRKPHETDYAGVNALTAVHGAACLLKPASIPKYNRLFDIQLDHEYLEQINKLEQVPLWQQLAEKVLAQHAKR